MKIDELETVYWKPEPLTPIPVLAHLWQMVFRRRSKRVPTWTFRLADATAVQMRPRPVQPQPLLAKMGCHEKVFEFEGLAHHSFKGSVAKDVFRVPEKRLVRDDSWIRMPFEIWAHEQEPDWTFKASGADTTVGWEKCHIVRDQTRRLLVERLSRVGPSMVLCETCLVCGKRLTDSVSLGRCLCRECWGSSSLAVPWMGQ
jgi:hypothetical protein